MRMAELLRNCHLPCAFDVVRVIHRGEGVLPHVPQEALDSASFKVGQDTVFPHGNSDNYIDSLQERAIDTHEDGVNRSTLLGFCTN